MYLPEIFKNFVSENTELANAIQRVGEICSNSGPVEHKAQHLIQLGISIGVGSRGGVRSHARRAIEAGASEKEIVQVVLMSTTIVGFPAMIAAYGWIQDVLPAKDPGRAPG